MKALPAGDVLTVGLIMHTYVEYQLYTSIHIKIKIQGKVQFVTNEWGRHEEVH